MKTLRYFLLSLTLTALATAHLDAMKRQLEGEQQQPGAKVRADLPGRRPALLPRGVAEGRDRWRQPRGGLAETG